MSNQRSCNISLNENRIGNSTKLLYDDCYSNGKIKQDQDSSNYMLNIDSIYNINTCLQTSSPGSTISSQHVVQYAPAMSQQLIDYESILTGRNMKSDKCNKVNNFNINDVNLINMDICNKNTNIETKNSKSNKELHNNYSLNLKPSCMPPLYWANNINTKLEAIDNYVQQSMFDMNAWNADIQKNNM